jgi:hypothetical protein
MAAKTLFDLPENVQNKIIPEPFSGCWIWIGAWSGNGYGQISTHHGKEIPSTCTMAHKHVYKLLVGDIPLGLVLDHLCRLRCCVNPAHLEPVSSRVNTLRGDTIPSRNLAKTHCPQGHSYSGENLFVSVSKTQTNRLCRKCRNDNLAKRRKLRRRFVEAVKFFAAHHHKLSRGFKRWT